MKNGLFMAIVLAVWAALKSVFKLLKMSIEVLSSIIVFLGLYIPFFYFFFGIILLATTSFSFAGSGTDQILYYVGFGICCLAAVIIAIRNLLVRPISSAFAAFHEWREDIRRSKRKKERDTEFDDRRAYDREVGEEREFRRRDGARFYRDDQYAYGNPALAEGDGSARYFGASYDSSDRYPDRLYGDGLSENDGRSRQARSVRDDYYGNDFRREELGGSGFARPDHPRTVDRGGREFETGGERNGSFGRFELTSPYSVTRLEKPLIYYSKRCPNLLIKEYSDRFELFEEDARGRRFLRTEYKDD